MRRVLIWRRTSARSLRRKHVEFSAWGLRPHERGLAPRPPQSNEKPLIAFTENTFMNKEQPLVLCCDVRVGFACQAFRQPTRQICNDGCVHTIEASFTIKFVEDPGRDTHTT